MPSAADWITLSEAQAEELRGLFSEAQFDFYLEEAVPESDCEPLGAADAVMVVMWNERSHDDPHSGWGCWVRADVDAEPTQTLLDTLSELQLALVDG